MHDLQNLLNVVLGILLLLGCALSLPIYWWLLVTPLVSRWKQYRAKQTRQDNLPS